MVRDILIVDDEEDIRELVSDILQDEGYQPRKAKDSITAFHELDERIPAAVILDIWLQGSQLDGLGILEIIKRKHPNGPVIMSRGHGNIETAINAIKLGAYDYIEKPFKEDRLLRLLKRAIETTRLEMENAELKTKGVKDEDIDGAFADCAIDWREQVTSVASKRFGELGPENAKERAKRSRFLQQRGFSFDEIATLY